MVYRDQEDAIDDIVPFCSLYHSACEWPVDCFAISREFCASAIIEIDTKQRAGRWVVRRIFEMINNEPLAS